jgi:hypothetical protein
MIELIFLSFVILLFFGTFGITLIIGWFIEVKEGDTYIIVCVLFATAASIFLFLLFFNEMYKRQRKNQNSIERPNNLIYEQRKIYE